ncbi:MAG: hypothetical protein VST70_05260 [Nitrospirota bacterium]|nr:hypothetical protein [Nitrospirota bacterium]
MKSAEVRSGLISLIDKKKRIFHGGISEIVKKEFLLISQARECGATWAEIVETLGFSGKEDGFTLAYWRERRRREKKGEVKTAPVQKIENEKQKNEAIPAAPTKTNGGRIGPPKPIGWGRLDLGCDSEDDEL